MLGDNRSRTTVRVDPGGIAPATVRHQESAIDTPAVTYSPSVRGGNVADPHKPRAPFAPWDRRELPGAFDVEESARRVGNYKWAEMKLFEALGGWATALATSTAAILAEPPPPLMMPLAVSAYSGFVKTSVMAPKPMMKIST